MPLNVLVKSEVRVLIDDEDTLLYLRDLTQNAHPCFHDNGEPDAVRMQRTEVFTACDRALHVIRIGDQYDESS